MRTAIIFPLLLSVSLQVGLAPTALPGSCTGRTQLATSPFEPPPLPGDGPAAAKRLTDAPRASVQPGDGTHLDDALVGAPPQGDGRGSSSPRIDAGASTDGASVHTGPRTPRAPPAAPLS